MNIKIDAVGVDDDGRPSLIVTGRLRIPLSELELRFSRSSGPGGQNVNKTSTRVEVRFNVLASQALSDAQKGTITAALGSRVDAKGWIRVVEQGSRSQGRNRAQALTKLRDLLRSGLAKPGTEGPDPAIEGCP